MLKMMIAFIKDYFKHRDIIKKHDRWIQKYATTKHYSLNPNKMMYTNLKIWLVEMEGIFGKRYCPCFEPSGDWKADKKLLCPCTYIDDEIAEYGTCHCSLFGAADLSKEDWKKSNQRVIDEYRIPLQLENGVLDTRGQPLDPRRELPVPDTLHQLKSTLSSYQGEKLTLLVATKQEVDNLAQVAQYRHFNFHDQTENGHFKVDLWLKKPQA